VRVDVKVVADREVARLARARFNRLVQLAETTSTNTVVAEEASIGAPEGLVVVADYQSAGRGRFERKWEAPRGASLLFSVLARPGAAELPPSRRHLAVAAVSLALAEAAGRAASVRLALKWPNDLIAAGAPGLKVAGLLAEVTTDGGLVVGAGLNVAWAPEGATCVEALAGRPVDRGALLVEALLALDRLYGDWDHVAQLYRESCATIGRTVTVSYCGRAPDLSGTAVDVDDAGRLLVRAAGDDAFLGRLVAVAAGDVVHARTGTSA